MVSYGADLSFRYVQSARVMFGAGVAGEAGLEVKALGCERALLVTDSFLRGKTDLCARVEKALGARLAGIFDGVVPDASVETIDEGAAMGRRLSADALVSLGGGSAIDTAKGIAVCLTLGGGIRDHQGTQFLGKRATPHVAIPTTAGTGSEVSMYVVVKDPVAREKMHYADERLIPDVALLDPEVTLGLPPALTAATGFDALTHAVEAYTSTNRNPLSDAQALHAIGLVAEHLPRALKDGGDLVARGQMLLASNLAGAAMSNSGVGLVHAIAHVVGARHGVHHGAANAIALPHVIRWNADEPALAPRYADVAAALGARGGDAADASKALLARCGLPSRYRDVGVPEADLAAIAQAAIGDGAIVYNGKFAAEASLVLGVLREAW
ncbi:MAG: iron-containing alcohol dehydrogenase [Myxococcota bacterium]